MDGMEAREAQSVDGTRLTYDQILDRDGQATPEILRERGRVDLGSAPVQASRYTDPEFFKREVRSVFLKTWQYACLEDDIPEAGDTYVFDLVGRSAIVARQRDGSIKAMRNVCLHRGRRLLQEGGCKDRLRCPYHGFTWNLDGSFVPNNVLEEFPEIDPQAFGLHEVRAETWGGLVFVNFDPQARPLLEVIDPLPRHFAHWRIDQFYRSAYVGKVMFANWKVVAEAFIENLHVAATHPQLSSYTNDANSHSEILSDHVGRVISATGYPGLLYDGPQWSQTELVERMFQTGSRAGSVQLVSYEPGSPARRYLGDTARAAIAKATGHDLSAVSDAEVIDAISYDLFPNFHPWGGLATRLCYRFRPVGLDHERTLMEVMLFTLAPKDKPRPAPAKLRMLGEDEPWARGVELGYFAGIFDQDAANMVAMQQGLRDLGDGVVHFARQAEIRCRNLHRMIDAYVAADEAGEPPP